jgi:hypothetical protein
MDTWHLSGLIIAATNVGLVLYMILLVREMRDGSRAALHNIQLQLAFVAGRIGLRNQDLERATARQSDTEPAPPPEVIGGQQWDDFEELIDRVERGEVTTEETRGAR